MNLRLTAVALLGLLVYSSAPAFAVSLSRADLYYPTYGRARHFDQSNEFLGTRGDRYDGVGWSTFRPAELATVTVRTRVGLLFGTGDFEYLSMWIDWDQDRHWGDDEEVIDLDDFWFDAGTSTYQTAILVPEDAVLGETWMRTRFSFDGDLTAAGDFVTGEVEDYQVHVGAVEPVPEAGSLLLLSCGLLPLLGLARSRGRRSRVG